MGDHGRTDLRALRQDRRGDIKIPEGPLRAYMLEGSRSISFMAMAWAGRRSPSQ